MDLPRSSGVQLHPTSLPGGRLGREALRVRRLARGRGAVVVADAAAGAARPARLAVQVGVGVRGVAGAAGLAAGAGDARRTSSTSASATRTGSTTGRGSARAVRSPTRCASTASGRRCGRMPSERGVRLIGDVPIYVAPGSVDHRAHPELFRDDAVAGTPPDAYTDKGQLWGNPLYDWPALRRRGYRWWTERLPAHVRALRPRADRPLPRLRRVLGGAARAPGTRCRDAGGAGRAGRRSTPRCASSARCR